ncbi:unnamed protein product [Calypogeia fissa]
MYLLLQKVFQRSSFSGNLSKSYARATQVAGEAVTNIRQVAAFNAETKVQALFAKELKGPAASSFLTGQVAGLVLGFSQLCQFGSYGLGMWYSGILVADEGASFGNYIKILIDGKDIKKYNLRSVRKHIALVQQEPALFATSIYQNIVYGKDGASEAEVIEAAKAANAHNFISSLPDGYKTQVGERGVQLSGGQKQRVAIAHTVLKDPVIVLLDEATLALDSELEKIVQDALDRLTKGDMMDTSIQCFTQAPL